ncbi:MAG: YfhO family protein, partial [Thermoanaerobaculia bacterium]|nr:YfhO family protein [Thermoanaerobaculia bacterium]
MNLTFLYIGAVYAILALLIRRYEPDLKPRIALLFYGMVVAFFFGSVVGDSIDLPADVLSDLPPWTEVLPEEKPVNESLNDIILQFVPWSHQVRESWRALEIPLWNASAGGGYPLLANAQSSALSPFRLIALPLDLAHSFAAEAALKLLVAMTFAFLWARRRDLSEISSVVVSTCFGFSMGLHAWLHFPHATTAAMIPAIFYAVDRLVLDDRRSGVVLVSLVFAVTLLSGHPETAAHAISFGGLWFFFVLLTSRPSEARKRVVLRMTGACVLALLLASPFLLSFLSALPDSLRMEAIRSGQELSVFDRSPDSLMLMLHGRFVGQVGESPWGPVHPEFASIFAGMIAVAGFLALTIQLILKAEWRRPWSFFVAAVLLTLMAIFEIPPVSSLLEIVPPFSIAANARLRIVLCWLLAVCAGAFVEMVRKRNFRAPIAGGAVFVVLLIVSFIAYDVFGTPERQKAVLTAIPGALSIASVFLLAGPRPARRLAPIIVLCLIATDLWLSAREFNPEMPRSYLYPETPLTQQLRDLTTDDPIGPLRITGVGGMFFPNAAAMYGLEDLRAHDPMANAQTLGFMRVLTNYSSQDYFGMLRRVDHPFLDFMNVRYLLTSRWERIDTPGFVKVYDGPDGTIWRNDEAMPRFHLAEKIVVEKTRQDLVDRLLLPESWQGTAVLQRDLPGVLPAGPGEPIDIDRKGPGSYRVWVNPPGPRILVTSLPWSEDWRVRFKGTTLESLPV